MKERFYIAGSLTVEAAFVVPAVIFVYIFVIYSAFYMHDCIQAEGYAEMIADHLIQSCLKNIEPDKKTVDYESEWQSILTDRWDRNLDLKKNRIVRNGQTELQNRMLASRVEHIEIESGFNGFIHEMQCTVKINGQMSFPIKLFGLGIINFEAEKTGKLIDAVKYLWKYR